LVYIHEENDVFDQRWHFRVAQLEHFRSAWNDNPEWGGDLRNRPAIAMIKDGDRIYAYGYDASFLSGLLALPCTYHIVTDEGGSQTLTPEFSMIAEMGDFIIPHLATVNRSGFIVVFVDPEGGVADDHEAAVESTAADARDESNQRLGDPETGTTPG
jgi:hypothetical protein